MSNRWFSGRVLTVALLFGLSVMQPMASSAVQAHQPGDKPRLEKLVGAWFVEIRSSITKDKVNGAVQALTSDGFWLGSRPTHPYETPAVGTWVATGPQTAAYTFMVLNGSETDVLMAKTKVVGTLQYDARTDTWSGSDYLTVTDLSGHIIATDTGTLKGTRIAIEAPPK